MESDLTVPAVVAFLALVTAVASNATLALQLSLNSQEAGIDGVVSASKISQFTVLLIKSREAGIEIDEDGVVSTCKFSVPA